MRSPKPTPAQERHIIAVCQRVHTTAMAYQTALDDRANLMRKLRADGWTIIDLAMLAGISHQRMSKVVDGNAKP